MEYHFTGRQLETLIGAVAERLMDNADIEVDNHFGDVYLEKIRSSLSFEDVVQISSKIGVDIHSDVSTADVVSIRENECIAEGDEEEDLDEEEDEEEDEECDDDCDCGEDEE